MLESIQILRVARDILSMGSLLYHGTSQEVAARQILNDGFLRPGEHDKKNFLTPVAGRVYLSQNLRYAIIYAIGGDMLGVEIPKQHMGDQNGYLFVVDGADIHEPQPDEDDIGGFICDGLNEIQKGGGTPWNGTKKCPLWLISMAQRNLTERQLQKVKEGEYAYFAQAGKKLVKRMTTEQKRELIDKWGANVANEGTIPIRQAWRFDKEKCQELKKDGSNFFQLAERIS